MKLTVFHSEKGDCLLLEGSGKTGGRMLIDGGMRDSYCQHVRPFLGQLAKKKQKVDVVYVSHIDQDHIAGVLQLLDDHVEWKVHDHLIKSGDNPDHPEPAYLRPPAIGHIWHNAFHELLKDNKGPIGDLLAASSGNGQTSDVAFAAQLGQILATTANLCLAGDFLPGCRGDGSNAAALRKAAEKQHELATSIPEAIRVSQRVSANQLDIPLNKPFGGKLAFVHENEKPSTVSVGGMQVCLIGPFEEDLAQLRKDWDQWLRANQERLRKLRLQAKRDAERLGTSDLRRLLTSQLEQASRLGDREKVTPPNLASLMLLVQENGKTILLTGDGHSRDILKGLNFHKKLDWRGRLHANVLKVQHHGSEHNLDEDFAEQITADDYIFCGNGEHENPDYRVVEAILNARLKDADCSAFKFWFNSSEGATEKSAAKEHMRELEKRMKQVRAKAPKKFEFEFLDKSKSSFSLKI